MRKARWTQMSLGNPGLGPAWNELTCCPRCSFHVPFSAALPFYTSSAHNLRIFTQIYDTKSSHLILCPDQPNIRSN